LAGGVSAFPSEPTVLVEDFMAAKNKTSAKAAKAASKVLRDGRTSKASKTAAGSALSQTPAKRKGK
jgi:hypothetical protein